MRKSDLKFARDIASAAEKSPYIWSVSYIALPKGVTWNFDDRVWQVHIMEDLHPRIVVRKPTQIGLTITSTTKTLWFISHYKSRAMYTLPRRDDVTDYVATTLNPMIEGSDYLKGRLGRTDTLRMKRIGDSYYHVMEASVTPRMLPVDILVNDEVDMSSQDNIEQFRARLDASKYKYHYQFSTPTVSGFGIDAEYERSDRREWFVTCSRCNHEQILEWEDSVVTDDNEPYLICLGCRERLRIEDVIHGRWGITNPGATTHGYHVSHLMLPITRPIETLVEEERVMDKRTFYNLRLGKPWKPIGGSMPLSLFRDNAFHSGHSMQTHRKKDDAKYYLGADQGNDIHVIVGKVEDGSDDLKIVYAEHISPRRGDDQFERLGAIIRMFDIDFGVIDANPNRHSAYNMAKDFHGRLGAADIGSYSYPFKWYGFTGDGAYKVVTSRTEILDGFRDDIASGKISFWGTWDTRTPIIKDVIRQCGNLKRDTAIRHMQGGAEKVVGTWRKVGDDHFAFAASLLRVAWLVDPSRSNFDFVELGDSVPQGAKGKKTVKSKVWEDTVYYVDEDDGKVKADRFY